MKEGRIESVARIIDPLAFVPAWQGDGNVRCARMIAMRKAGEIVGKIGRDFQ